MHIIFCIVYRLSKIIGVDNLVWFAPMGIHISNRVLNGNAVTIGICKRKEKLSRFIP